MYALTHPVDYATLVETRSSTRGHSNNASRSLRSMRIPKVHSFGYTGFSDA